MTKEEKQLLLNVLCALLPYGVKVRINTRNNYYNAIVCEITRNYICVEGGGEMYFSHGTYKPYLRSMSSMTEDEILELKELCTIYIPSQSLNIAFEDYGIMVLTHHFVNDSVSFKLNMKAIDWLNEHYFDYRGLIKKGLALEAPEGMYNTKTE